MTREDCGSERKLAAACRKVSHHAKVAWRKRKLFRKTGTLKKCGWRKEFAAARIRMTRCAKVARRSEHDRKRYDQDNVASRTPRGQTFGRKRQPEPECSNGIRGQGAEEQQHLRKGRKTAKSIGGRRKHCFVYCCIVAGTCFEVTVLAWRKYTTLLPP
jgi:hypothetical protein